MRKRVLAAMLLTGVVMTAGACATSEEWAEWKGHSSHFATGDHLFFSVRNREGTAPRVARTRSMPLPTPGLNSNDVS